MRPHSLHSLSLLVFALLACTPDKQSSTDASTGGSTTSGTSQPVTSSSTTTSDAPTTSSTTSTDPATDTEPTSTTGTTGTSSTTEALPVEDCEEQLDQVDCEAIIGRSGHSDCVWLETVAQWSREGGCDVSAGPSRCVQGRYGGDGCFGSACPGLERVYIRDLGDGIFEVVNNPGGTCGVDPDGWKQCLDEDPEAPAPCSCVC
jgi:hypothetical protein